VNSNRGKVKGLRAFFQMSRRPSQLTLLPQMSPNVSRFGGATVWFHSYSFCHSYRSDMSSVVKRGLGAFSKIGKNLISWQGMTGRRK